MVPCVCNGEEKRRAETHSFPLDGSRREASGQEGIESCSFSCDWQRVELVEGVTSYKVHGPGEASSYSSCQFQLRQAA